MTGAPEDGMQGATGDDHSPRLARPVSEQIRTGVHLVRWILLGAVAGASPVSLVVGLPHRARPCDPDVTRSRVARRLLPAAGLVFGAVYHYSGVDPGKGNAVCMIDEIHEPTDWVPRRMAPLVLRRHGGRRTSSEASAGREGTAIQMSGSLTDAFVGVAAARRRRSPDDAHRGARWWFRLGVRRSSRGARCSRSRCNRSDG